MCYLKPYVPSHFALQFGYDKLYVSNSNTNLAFMGSLIDGAQAWRYFIAGCTEARLCILNLLMILGFCQWYEIFNSTPTGFNINSSGLKLISIQMK